MLAEGDDPERAVAVATYLGLWSTNCRLRLVHSTVGARRPKISRSTFPRQAIAMVWDYAEIDPFHDVSGSWDGAVRWIELAIRHCSASSGSIPPTFSVATPSSSAFPDGTFDAVIVDPPYYDAIQYGDLSDFFYVWLKRSIGHLHPGVFGTPLTPKQQEVIESRADKKSPEYISHEEFEQRLQNALA